MPEHDILRFVIVGMVIFLVAIIILKVLENWHDRAMERLRIKGIQAKMDLAERYGQFNEMDKERYDLENDPPRS